MGEAAKYLRLYENWLYSFEDMSDADYGHAIRLALKYFHYGERPSENEADYPLFIQMKALVDMSIHTCKKISEKNRENAKLRVNREKAANAANAANAAPVANATDD